ncbi:MAG: TolC family protein [Armatimonadetes bacterium]|nr:TolC family protein [Armatimonadota bacterium]
MPFRILWLALALLAALSARASAEGLSLDAAVARALSADPAAPSYQQRIERLRLAARLAGAPDSLRARISAVFGEADEEANQLAQSFPLGGQPGLRRNAALHELEAAVAELEARRLEVAHQAARSYLNAQSAAVAADLARREVAALEAILDITRRRFEVGEVPRSQVVRATRERVAGAREVLASEAAEAGARASLALALGTSDLPPIPPLSPPAPPDTPLETLVADALARRPDLATARAEVEVLRGQAGLARAERSPEVELSLYQGKLVGLPRDQGARVSLQWPLLDWGRARAAAAAADARTAEASARLAVLERTARLEVGDALAQWRRLHHERGLLEREEAVAAAELVEMLERGYADGLVTMLEVIEARHVLRDVRREEASLAAREAQAALDLQRALGRVPGEPFGGNP